MLSWFPIAVVFVVSGATVGVTVKINTILGPSLPSQIKGEAFECGDPPTGSAFGRFSVHFICTPRFVCVAWRGRSFRKEVNVFKTQDTRRHGSGRDGGVWRGDNRFRIALGRVLL